MLRESRDLGFRLRTSALTFALCNSLLSPIGDHRSQHVLPSRGKRKTKRKREHEYPDKDEDGVASRQRVPRVALPTRPAIQRHVTLGFNATTRYLEDLARQSNARRGNRHGLQEETAKDSNVVALDCPKNDTYMPLAAIFVPHSDQPAMLYAHIPLLAKLTSSAFATLPPTRLVILPKGAEQKLGSALGIPRVGLIGLYRGAPEAAALMEFVKQKVPEIEASWVEEATAGSYLPVKIHETETRAPIGQKCMSIVS